MRRLLRGDTLLKRFLSMELESPDFIPVDKGLNNIEMINDKYKRIIEGQAEVRVKKHVFYNPVQQFNRDLSVAVLTVFLNDYRAQQIVREEEKSRRNMNGNAVKSKTEDEIPVEILEALSASGLRSIRYAKEVPNITKIIANDICENALETMNDNIKNNGVDHLVETSLADACELMYRHRQRNKRFAAVDLDPYGCPTMFLDSAVQCVQDGGMLLVTATDMAVLAGVVPESCYNKYGAVSLKTKSCHEMALRILLMSIEQHANRHNRYIVPLLSIAADFYVRVFVQVFTGAALCRRTTSKLSMVFHCVGCDTTTLHPLGGWKPNKKPSNPHHEKAYLPTGPPVNPQCEHCNQKHHIGGPIWSAPIHKEFFVSSLLTYVENNAHRFSTSKRMEGILSVVEEELHDVPLYYALDKLLGCVHLSSMPMMKLRSAILNGGYRVSFSHAARKSIKTDAPPRFLWDIVRTWEQQYPVSMTKRTDDPVTRHILSQPRSFEIDLSERGDANPASRQLGRLRYQRNPLKYWGPGSRATVNTGDERQLKAIKNQNKNKDKRRRSPASEDEPHKKQNTEELTSEDTIKDPDTEKCIKHINDIENKSEITNVEIKS